MTGTLDPFHNLMDDAFADFNEVVDAELLDETAEFTPNPPNFGLAPPVGWVPVTPDAGTPFFDAVNADVQHPRTATGRVSKRAPRLPYTGGLSYAAFVAASRADHCTYFGGAR